MRKTFSAATAAILSVFLAVLFAGGTLAATDGHGDGHGESSSGGITLSAGVKTLLAGEMAEVERGMVGLVSAIASGRWHEISETARKMEESYIMKRSLTKEQAAELREKLPQGFKELDGEFHATAGKLSRAAESRDGELVVFYFHRLAESCVRCHSTYARQRFPGFKDAPASHDHHH